MFKPDQVDHALGLLLDDDRMHEALEARALEIAGRPPHADKDEDTQWWEGMTTATAELLTQMQAANTLEANTCKN